MYWLLKIRNKNGTLLNLTLNRASALLSETQSAAPPVAVLQD